MTHPLDRRRFFAAALATAAGAPIALGQDRDRQPAERKVDPVDLPLDKPGIWTLHFRYKAPRIIPVDGFDAKGKPARQTVWYMWYQVYNRGTEPVYFIPEFELHTRDLNTTHLDEPQPYIFEQVKRFEDRTIDDKKYPKGVLDLKSTIDISEQPIPPSKPDAIPRTVSGLAVWTDMAEKAPRTNRFSVYVTGLSNGLATEQAKLPTGEVVTLIKRKTLRINFVRPTDDARQEITDIRPDDTDGPAEAWVYRTTTELKGRRAAPGEPPEKKPDEPKPPKD